VEASARTGNELAGLNGLGDALGRGVLPAWAPYAVVLGVAAVVAALLAATGSFGIVLLAALTVVVSAVVLYVISRTVEGSRRATDRLVTLGITSAFFLAVIPLVSVLYQVIKRGAARFDADFFTESARGVIGAGGGHLDEDQMNEHEQQDRTAHGAQHSLTGAPGAPGAC